MADLNSFKKGGAYFGTNKAMITSASSAVKKLGKQVAKARARVKKAKGKAAKTSARKAVTRLQARVSKTGKRLKYLKLRATGKASAIGGRKKAGKKKVVTSLAYPNGVSKEKKGKRTASTVAKQAKGKLTGFFRKLTGRAA